MPLDALLDDHDGLALAELIRRGEVSPLELLEAVIARIEARDPALGAVVHRFYDDARAELAAQVQEGGTPEGPFAGLPFLLKDLYSFQKGRPCGNGSRWLKDYRAPFDDPMAARWRAAGLTVVGKTATAEFGLNVTTETRQHGATRNPWNPDYSSGGSSGGAGAAVAAGMVPLAHASDGGGSIRIPASCCGLFGLKPSRGRNFTSDAWAGLGVFHAITRSVRDSAALLDATCGPPRHHPYCLPKPETPFLASLKGDPGRLRIAWSARTPADVDLHPQCRAAVDAAAALAADFGHAVEEAAPEVDHAKLREAMVTIVAANMADTLSPGNPWRPEGARREDVETQTWIFAERGRQVSSAQYLRAVTAVREIGFGLARFFQRFDVLLTPTMAAPPPRIGLLDTMVDDFDAFGRKVQPYVAFTQMFNMSGQPAASLPLHWTPEGLPVGVQIAGRVGEEATLLALAAQFEQARPWFDRRPPL
ncbi:amidase [Pelagibius marinus]|uniref:amidase n=1 Tax=Pelagibius marinus TaxID=2762760 RepID=UPI0029C9CC8F|nr:amidase [Pelagibius marinus]